MGPDHLKFGGGVTQTVLNPAVLILVLIAGVMICVWPRKKAMVAFLAAAILIPTDQVLLIAGAHFPVLRLLVLFGIIRMVREKRSSKMPLFSGGMNKIDIALILLTIFTAVNGMLLFQASGAVIYQLGELYTVFGVYFLLRSLIRDEEDVIRTIQTLACIATVVAVIMSYEIATGHNPYALLGGAHSSAYANLMQRDNKIRAIGCFSHPILAGTFGAVLVPLFVALWWKGRKYRAIAALGIVSATVMTVACNSSTPVLGYAAGVLALCLWPLRNWMRAVRWGIVFTVVSLHLVMKAPVWHLIARIDITGGSSSWHRFMLVDQCIRHFGDWWLVGVKDTSVWGWDMWDTANQYVGTCENSGLIPFLLFLAVLVYGFRYLGKARRAAGNDKKKAVFIWGLGAALFANVVAFFGISYFDQTIVAWYGLLALISVAVATPRRKEAALSKLRNTWEPAIPPLQLASDSVSDRVSDRVGSEEVF
jgi:cbb3-type cytochrome oxidase subunit 3